MIDGEAVCWDEDGASNFERLRSFSGTLYSSIARASRDHRRRRAAELDGTEAAIESNRHAMGLTMAKAPSPEMIATVLTVPERLLLFCLASGTDWQKVPGVTHSTAQRMLVRGLIDRDGSATNFLLNDQGRAVLDALMGRGKG